MKFNLKDLNPGTWFYFDESNPDDGSIKIRVLSAGKLAEIRDKTIKTEAEYRDGKRHEYQVVDNAARDCIVWDYCIVDWENLFDDDGAPIECTAENKLTVMNEHVGFASFVNACLKRLNREQLKIDEDSEKN